MKLNVKIEDIRELKKKIFKTTLTNKKRFIILDDVELFNKNSLNALLKLIEEPSSINNFILINNKSNKLLNTIKSIQKLHNKDLSIEGLLLTMYDTRLNLSNQVKKEVKLHFNEMVFKTVIHRNVRLGEATSYGKSIIDYDVSSKGADNYLNLAKEIISKN